METPLDIDRPLPLLGDRSPAAFMQRYWHKRPLLIRQAVPDVRPPVTRAELFKLAATDGVESRLIVKTAASRRAAGPGWTLQHGPIRRKALPPIAQPGWTVLVQGLDLHVPAARQMLSQFRFVPEARVDDLMISYASDGGGVGPHFDSYNVFLLQVHGRRRWRIGRLKDPQLQPNVPLKILTNFEPEFDWVLEPGDMLYLPPRWAHDGVAEGECMTCSAGFRSPGRAELVAEVLSRIGEDQDDDGVRYTDPRQAATDAPGRIPSALRDWTVAAVQRALSLEGGIGLALGEALTEPKPTTWFDPDDRALDPQAPIELHRRTRMLYDDTHVFVNGASWRAAGKDARLLRRLADHRGLSVAEIRSASEALREWLQDALCDGWISQPGCE